MEKSEDNIYEVEPAVDAGQVEHAAHEAAVFTAKTEQNTQAARVATDLEHRMGLIESARLYPKAIFFSMVMSLAIIQEGYDTALLGNFFAQPAFQLRFGKLANNGTHQIPPPWAAGLQNGAAVGEILGLWGAGLLAERYGYKKTLMGCLLFLICAIFICFFAVDLGMLFAGEVLCGLPWGAFQTLTTTYAADVTPIHLRPVLTSYVNLCWVTGQLIAVGVLKGFVDRTDQWGWRIPYAIQWVREGNTIRCSCLGLAGSNSHWYRTCPRISMVARTQRTRGRGETCPPVPHVGQERRFQRRRYYRNDDPHQRT